MVLGIHPLPPEMQGTMIQLLALVAALVLIVYWLSKPKPHKKKEELE